MKWTADEMFDTIKEVLKMYEKKWMKAIEWRRCTPRRWPLHLLDGSFIFSPLRLISMIHHRILIISSSSPPTFLLRLLASIKEIKWNAGAQKTPIKEGKCLRFIGCSFRRFSSASLRSSFCSKLWSLLSIGHHFNPKSSNSLWGDDLMDPFSPIRLSSGSAFFESNGTAVLAALGSPTKVTRHPLIFQHPSH